MDYPKHLIVLFIMTISIISGTITQAQKTKVTIHNDIGGGLSLWYNCKSGNNNLGDRRLAPGGSWPFDFKPDVFGRTLFFCRFSWGNEWHHFDIYKQERDREFEKFGCRKCEWKIRKNGPCKLNKSNGMFDVCFPWNAKKLGVDKETEPNRFKPNRNRFKPNQSLFQTHLVEDFPNPNGSV